MDKLSNDIIFNMCRYLPYPKSKAFRNISLPIDRMILNNEFHKFYEAYAEIEEDAECDWCGCDREDDNEMKLKDIGDAGDICYKCYLSSCSPIKNDIRTQAIGINIIWK